VVSFTPRPLYPRKKGPRTHWIGGWVDLRTGLDDVEKRKFFLRSGLELRLLGCPARSQSLYRVRYPGSLLFCHVLSVSFVCKQSGTTSRDSSVPTATSYGLDGPGLIPGRTRFFSSSQCPKRLRGPPSLLSNGYRGLFPSE
jgi:hypothetical protein